MQSMRELAAKPIPNPGHYKWLIVCGSFSAFLFGWGTGANDVANAFGTSVGARTLTVGQACVIAGIFEFVGAFVLGRVSTSTIAGGIASTTTFQWEPYAYSYGMMWTLLVGGLWQGWASMKGLNVSATHSIIGGIMGFALVFGGKDGVLWISKDPTTIPPYKGVVPIVLSWFVSPVFTGVCSAIIFWLLRTFILRSPHASTRVYYVLPLLVLCTTWLNIYFVFTKGAKKMLVKENGEWSNDKSAWISFVVAVGLAFLSCLLIPWMKKRVERAAMQAEFEKGNISEMPTSQSFFGSFHNKRMAQVQNFVGIQVANAEVFLAGQWRVRDFIPWAEKKIRKLHSYLTGRVQLPATNTSNQEESKDADDEMNDSTTKLKRTAKEIEEEFLQDVSEEMRQRHERAEKFDPKVEHALSFLQVFSAICVIFAHGAGEVGYMAGPLATIVNTHNSGLLQKKQEAPLWVIALAASSLVVGLLTYGRKVTKAMGCELSKLTPSRGFAAELSTSTVIMVAAQYGLPTSSSQCITGGIIGVGILEGLEGVNWKYFGELLASWIGTMFVMGLTVACLFAQGYYSPHSL
jgi:sodium-dependent phosphate transporter